MEKHLFAILGRGGFAREVMPLVQELLKSSAISAEAAAVFVTDLPLEDQAREINGVRILSFEEYCSRQADSKKIAIAMADAGIRRQLSLKVKAAGLQLFTVIAPNSLVLKNVELGEGSILCPFVTLTSNISIGSCFHANLYSYVGHDCVIGDFVTFAPGVKCNANVVIEDDVYVGTAAIIKQGASGRPTVIGKGAKIAAGAFVTKSVPAGQTVIGNPAVPLTRAALRRSRNG